MPHLLRTSHMKLRVISQHLSLGIMVLCSDAHEHSYKPVTLVYMCVDITVGMGSFVSAESSSRIHNLSKGFAASCMMFP